MFCFTSAMLVIAFTGYAQDEKKSKDYEQAYITVTTAHWNWDNEGSNERWLELEQEYFDKVTSKNEYIVGSGVYHHLYTGDNSEVIFVTVYPSWSAIEKAGERDWELTKEAWPHEEERKALAKERNSYYSGEHEDEIMVTWPQGKPLTSVPEDPLVYLVVDRHLAFPEDAKEGEMASLLKEFHENVTHKNEHLKAFYIHRHAWGSDGRDVSTVYVMESMADLENFHDRQDELLKAYWPDKEKRKEFFEAMNKYFTPWHSDRFYQSEPTLMKITTPPMEEDKAADIGN